jgi:23S rRNA pseudouridine2605 synthase
MNSRNRMAKADTDGQKRTVRLNKFLARAGFGSRRSAEELIRRGQVTINGQTVADLGRQVDPEQDLVAVDGQPARLPEDFRVYAFHKPLDVVSTLKAQGGQPSLEPYRLSADIPARFVPIGRLDAESTGLLLWTDDGVLNQRLARPSSGVWKTYEVELSEPLSENQIPTLTEGKLSIDGRPCRPCRLNMAPDRTTRHWIMEIHEGRRRQIRRMFKKVGIKVLRLHRVQVGPVRLGKLRPGDFRRLSSAEVQALQAAVAGQPD